MTSLGKIGLLLLLCATTIGGFLWLPPAVGFQNPALARIVVFHVPCSMVAYLATFVAAWYAIRYLWKRDLMDDAKSRVSFALGLVFWALTTVTGAIFAKVQWGAYWNWDIKQGAILMLLLVFIAYFALRAAIDDPRKAATVGAAYALFALLSAPYLTYVLPNSTPDTLHPKGTLEGGLSPAYSLTLWAGVLGLSLVYVWAFRLHVAVEVMALRMQKCQNEPPPPSRPRASSDRGTDVQSLLPLMLVPLLVWIAVWVYLWTLDGKVKRLQQDLQRVERGEEDEL